VAPVTLVELPMGHAVQGAGPKVVLKVPTAHAVIKKQAISVSHARLARWV
jgi:hypothetical protein